LVLILEKLMLVKAQKSSVKVVSAHLAEINLDKSREDPVLQSFVLPSNEQVLTLEGCLLIRTTVNPHHCKSAPL
jgi:hypothetical protein